MDLFDLFKSVADWFTDGSYGFFEEFTAYLFQSFILLWFKLQLEGIKFAYNVATLVLDGLNISGTLTAAWNTLPSDMAAARFFRIPEAFSLLISAGATRMVMSFIPGL